ncbi:hypothetical protein E2C01_050352 [Portunus trituberculatus]|uniref:Uncharacterized protein n=1 Tax=Portunus trituberculatus TaxID=210409 RepID=A0A5B7GBV5_PORTR|nr:hypothetical protein [Portunus trituberculatus]
MSSNRPCIRIAVIRNSLLSGAAPKRIQTYRASDLSIPLGGSTYSHAILYHTSLQLASCLKLE